MTNGEINSLRGRARRRGLDFAKSRKIPTEDCRGNYRLWRIDTGEILAGLLWDATDTQVRDIVEAEVARLDALAGRYRKPARSTFSGEAA